MKENIDFSLVNPMLRKQYCENFGRPAKEPEMMFKLLFLKKLCDLSDETLISSAQTDMTYKFFLDLEPEAKTIDPSLLTKFRKTRITEDILEEMLKETIRDIRSKDDKDTQFGYKTATSIFYGYKNHLAMTEERLIAGVSVTHGGAPDGQELPGLIECCFPD